MTTSPNYALYYPTIEFNSYEWLWGASLLWDRIYRIVPRSYTPEDPYNVKVLTDEGSIGIPIHPDDYTKEIADKFIDGMENEGWNASALTINDPEKVEYIRLHKDKVDVKLKDIIISKGTSNKDWFYIPCDFGGLYMTYLAKEISKRNNLQLVSDSPEAWTGATYFKYNGRVEIDVFSNQLDQFKLASLIIRDFLPKNILSINPKEIIEFRRKRRYERQKFMESVKSAASRLSSCKDPKIVNDLIEDLRKDIEEAIAEYKKSADNLKVSTWTGIKSISFPILSRVAGNLISVTDPLGMKILSATGIALGCIMGLSEFEEKQKKLSKESDYSYLLHLGREWQKNNHHSYDYNGQLWKNMEEFIND